MSKDIAKRSAMDSRLLSLARKSPDEIAEITGLESRYVAERITHLLESRGWLSDRQEERLLLEEITDLKDEVMARMKLSDDQTFSATANVALRALKLISERIDSRKKLVQADIAEITQAQAKVFGAAFDKALTHIVQEFKAAEEPDNEMIDAFVSDGLRLAVKQLESNVSSE
jgi:hypothetical protein